MAAIMTAAVKICENVFMLCGWTTVVILTVWSSDPPVAAIHDNRSRTLYSTNATCFQGRTNLLYVSAINTLVYALRSLFLCTEIYQMMKDYIAVTQTRSYIWLNMNRGERSRLAVAKRQAEQIVKGFMVPEAAVTVATVAFAGKILAEVEAYASSTAARAYCPRISIYILLVAIQTLIDTVNLVISFTACCNPDSGYRVLRKQDWDLGNWDTDGL